MKVKIAFFGHTCKPVFGHVVMHGVNGALGQVFERCGQTGVVVIIEGHFRSKHHPEVRLLRHFAVFVHAVEENPHASVEYPV